MLTYEKLSRSPDGRMDGRMDGREGEKVRGEETPAGAAQGNSNRHCEHAPGLRKAGPMRVASPPRQPMSRAACLFKSRRPDCG
eukprot:362408-Chlamydomonas_euryale.AAC.3